MKNGILPINWFDLLLLVWLVMGIFRGRKRGMSAELMTFLQWIATVIACAFAYQPLGDVLVRYASMSRLPAYIVAYLLTMCVVALVFVMFKNLLHGKLVGSDAFGKAEYYLGMPAGLVRFACIMIALLAILNAKFYSVKEIQAIRKYQMDNYDSEFFPGLHTLQANVFEESFTGPYIKKYLSFLLIRPTESGGTTKFKQKDWVAP